MNEAKNFLLGYGERLTQPIRAPGRKGDKKHPYTFEQAKQRLKSQINATAAKLKDLPARACPNNKTVAMFVLHPSYLAKSYYPDEILNTLGFNAVGSRHCEITPERWTNKKHAGKTVTSEFFIAGDRSCFVNWAKEIDNWNRNFPGADDLRKLESIRAPYRTIRSFVSGTDYPLCEVVVHAGAHPKYSFILDGLKKFAKDLDVDLDLDKRIHVGGLCFLPVKVPTRILDKFTQFSFLRVIREMPLLRQFRPELRISSYPHSTYYSLPTEPALDKDIKVAVFDGGLPYDPRLTQWTKRYKTPNLVDPVDDYLNHGHAVTSALLFGPLRPGGEAAIPFAPVDHYRVLDEQTGQNPQDELYDVLNRITNCLANKNYDFVNLSIGPALPIEDDEVTAWTASLDNCFAGGQTLATIAVGNSGENDRSSGNARIQVPSDCVNALSIGASDSMEKNWNRASYSSIGPGRSPGFVKPDAVAFGGSKSNPFWVLNPDKTESLTPIAGTSFASPYALRMAVGIRALLGSDISPLALKSLLIHRCDIQHQSVEEVGWGRISSSIEDLITCPDGTAYVLYQGELEPAQWIRAPIPIPADPIKGMVKITASICYATDIDPQDAINYTRSGLDIVFRPNKSKREKKSPNAKSKSFFKIGDLHCTETELRSDAHKWEPTMRASVNMRGSSLEDPVFDIHYNARTSGGPALNPRSIPYALVISIKAKNEPDLYDLVYNRYRTQLEILRPVLQIPIQQTHSR